MYLGDIGWYLEDYPPRFQDPPPIHRRGCMDILKLASWRDLEARVETVQIQRPPEMASEDPSRVGDLRSATRPYQNRTSCGTSRGPFLYLVRLLFWNFLRDLGLPRGTIPDSGRAYQSCQTLT